MADLRPPFAYYGGKTSMAAKIVDHFPEHSHYVEPFAGSLSVLLAKPRSKMETVNDLDQDLMTFWRVLRDQPEGLERALRMTPHSRAEYEAARDLDAAPTDLERARRVWVILSQGRGSTLRRTGWRFYRDPAGSSTSFPGYLNAYANRVPPAAARLHGVSLDCRDALDVIRDYGKHPNVLLYCDPPYLAASRNSKNYRHEMAGRAEHIKLAEVLHDADASVILSGYPSSLYDDLFGDWCRVDMEAWTGNGVRNGRTRTDGARTEVLWSNRDLVEQTTITFDEETA